MFSTRKKYIRKYISEFTGNRRFEAVDQDNARLGSYATLREARTAHPTAALPQVKHDVLD